MQDSVIPNSRSKTFTQWRWYHFCSLSRTHLQWPHRKTYRTRMWANDQRDGRPAEHKWRPLFNVAVWLTLTTWLLYS